LRLRGAFGSAGRTGRGFLHFRHGANASKGFGLRQLEGKRMSSPVRNVPFLTPLEMSLF
jgi:hypothetical protein